MSSDLSQVTQLVSQDLASPTGHRGTVRDLQVPNTMMVYSALPSTSTCLPSSALREERTDWKSQAQVTHQGYWEDCVPTPGVSRTLVYLLKPLGQWGPAKPWLQKITPPRPIHMQDGHTLC